MDKHKPSSDGDEIGSSLLVIYILTAQGRKTTHTMQGHTRVALWNRVNKQGPWGTGCLVIREFSDPWLPKENGWQGVKPVGLRTWQHVAGPTDAETSWEGNMSSNSRGTCT